MRRRTFPTLLLSMCLVTFPSAAEPAARVGGIDLVWHWEGAGQESSHAADETINPASVVKVATTLWALEELGPQQRFLTTFYIRGELNTETGVLDGDLVVAGSGDPDFHVENAQLVANRLREMGIRSIGGTLSVNDAFWIGWENGSEGRIEDPARRAAKMAKRLADAWNPRTWRPGTLRAMEKLRASRPGLEFVRLPVGQVGGLHEGSWVAPRAVEHRSNPLHAILKRFNAYSNNDVERLGHRLGDAAAMTRYFNARWGNPRPPAHFETLSGLGSNRLTPRQAARLVRELTDAATEAGLELEDLLPALGCGKTTLRNYRGLLEGLPAGGLVGKTGTLVNTDGGVITLAGSIATEAGDVTFFIGAPRNGARMTAARRAQTRWLLRQTEGRRVLPAECDDETLHSYRWATTESR